MPLNWGVSKSLTTSTLYLTPQTTNDADVVAVRARNVNAQGFEAALFEQESLFDGHLTEEFEQESLFDGHLTEEIGYLAIYSL